MTRYAVTWKTTEDKTKTRVIEAESVWIAVWRIGLEEKEVEYSPYVKAIEYGTGKTAKKTRERQARRNRFFKGIFS